MKRWKTRLKFRSATSDDDRTRMALVDTKAYDGVRKDRDEEKYSSNDVLKKDRKRFACVLKCSSSPVTRMIRLKSSYRGTKIYWFHEKSISA